MSRWQLSVGEISGWLPPLLWAAAILLSAWVLSDARRRRLPLYAVAAFTLATLLSPSIVLPLYFITRIFTRKPDATGTLEASTSSPPVAHTQAASSPARTLAADDADEQTAPPTANDNGARHWRTRALPLLYALVLFSFAALYFYRDYHSFDAHLARAANARLLEKWDAATREYRAALRLSDDAHTHKLLALQLAETGQTTEALAEFRAAERGGEPDALILYRMAHLLDALNRPAEANIEYRKFAQTALCALAPPDPRCTEALTRVQQIPGKPSP